ERMPGRRTGQRLEPDRDRRSLSPRDRRERRTHRLRGRPRTQALAFGSRTKLESSMNESQRDRARTFPDLHAPGHILVLPNAWDAGSARFIESCGAAAIATTSAGLAWAHGYPDGNALPAGVLATALAEIARAVTVPLSVDFEAGYSSDPARVA